MFWLLKKIFGIGVLAALVFFALQFRVGNRTVKDYLSDFYKAPLIQEVIRQGRGTLNAYIQKGMGKSEESPQALDKVTDEDKQELEKVLKKETHSR